MRNYRSAAAIAATVGMCALGPSVAPVGAAQPQARPAQVSLFHGIPGQAVDVYVNGQKLLPNFQPGTLTPSQPLPPGSFDVKVFKAGANPASTPAAEKKVDVSAGMNVTLVAHLTTDGKPALNTYVNDVSKVAPGLARLTVRHVAAAPAVDVRANGKVVFKGLENPKEATTAVPAGTVNADVTLAGTQKVVIGPATLPLKEGTSNVVYAWGSAQEKNLALKVQTFSRLQTAPGGVRGGQNDVLTKDGPGSAAWAAWTAAGAATVAGLLIARRSARRDTTSTED